MPKNKDLKRLVRTRMRKTGESYTAARSKLILKKESATSTRSDTDLAARAGMSDETVYAKTKKTWSQWVRALDAVDAASMAHREIAAYVHAEHGVPGWWAQTVTVGYERIRGLRQVGQRRSGSFEVTKSKTMPVPIATLYRAFSTERGRNQWLPRVDLKVRKAMPEKSMRITWGDGTPVEVYFIGKGERKSQVAIQHRKLATRDDANRVRAFWGQRLDGLAELLG